jgi:hypothetical protein
MPASQTYSLIAAELVTFSVFIDRWAHRPNNMISQFLYDDTLYRRIFTLYTFLHLAVFYLQRKCLFQQGALAVAAVGWVWLIVWTNHGPRALHILGAVVYMVGIFVFAYLRSFDYSWAVLRVAIQVLTTLTVGLALAFAYFESYRSHVTYKVENSLFVMCQVMYAFFAHYHEPI